jgi:hypothetical protein
METVGATVMDELDCSLNQVAGYLNAQHAALVDLTVELLDHENWWDGPGVHTPELYLAWRTGVSPEMARQLVQIARRSKDLPVCLDTFRRGELSVDQMAAIARRAPWWTDSDIADVGVCMTVSQLRRTLGKYGFPVIAKPDDSVDNLDTPNLEPDSGSASHPDADSAGDDDPNNSCNDGPDNADDDASGDGDGSGKSDWCRFGFDDDGRFRLNLKCDTETGAIIEAALSESRDRLFQSGQTNVTWIDSVREASERSLDTITEPARRDRYRINIHLDTEGQATDSNGGTRRCHRHV